MALNVHRYRLIGSLENDLILVTEYGDICSFVGEWEETRTEYNHMRIFDAMQKFPHLDLWSALGQDDVSINDWYARPTVEEFVEDAISWLCPDRIEDKWVRDDSLFPYLFDVVTEEKAKQCLKSKGYFVDNLWSVADVFSKVDCTEREAQVVLKNSLTSEAVYDAIWYSIEYHAEEFGEIKKEVEGE